MFDLRKAALPALFVVIVGLWGVSELADAGPAAPLPLAATRVAPGATSASPAPGSAAPADETSPSPEVAVPAPVAAAPGTAIAPVTDEPSPAPVPYQSAPASRPAAAPAAPGNDSVLAAALDADARAFTSALQAGDAATVGSLLAARCRGVNAAALVAKRRAQISDDVGMPIEKATVVAPQLIHFDPGAGEAHAFLGLDSGGRRLYTSSVDGWLYENGRWRNAECS